MTAIGHDTRFAFSDRGVQLSRMRVPWTRGATSGALLVILGAWAAIVPFIGPYLNFAYTPATDTAWHWTSARGWFEVAPGVAAIVGGLLLLGGTNRGVAVLGSWLAVAGGAWLIVGPSLADVLSQSTGTPDPSSSTNVQALEELFFFYGIGALILFFGAVALGRLSVQSVRDVAAAERRAARAESAAPAYGGTHSAAETGEAYPPAPTREAYPPAETREGYPSAEGRQGYPPAETSEGYPSSGTSEAYPRSGTGEAYPPSGTGEAAPPAEGRQAYPPPDTRNE